MAVRFKAALRIIALDGGVCDFQLICLTVRADGGEVWEGFILQLSGVFFRFVNDV